MHNLLGRLFDKLEQQPLNGSRTVRFDQENSRFFHLSHPLCSWTRISCHVKNRKVSERFAERTLLKLAPVLLFGNPRCLSYKPYLVQLDYMHTSVLAFNYKEYWNYTR